MTKENPRVRNAVSDDTLYWWHKFFGGIKPGNMYYLNQENGHLAKVTIGSNFEMQVVDLGRRDCPENLVRQYRNIYDASLRERIRMIAGKSISLWDYVYAFFHQGWLDRKRLQREHYTS